LPRSASSSLQPSASSFWRSTASLTARDLWWQFAFDAQAPRALRALVGASALAAAFAVGALLRAPKGVAEPPSPSEVEPASQILRRQARAETGLALQRDNSLLFSASGESFLMFGKRGRSWIALFDPVGPVAERPDLIRRFVALAREHGGRAAFYEVPAESLPLYLDAGLTVMKIGEEALVLLSSFGLAGGAAAHLRYARKRGARAGLSFELVPPERSKAALKTIEAISSEWLEERTGEEKGFSSPPSIAAFSPAWPQPSRSTARASAKRASSRRRARRCAM